MKKKQEGDVSTIKHVAIIMDGNGRWAQARSRPRVWGHVRGSHTVSSIVRRASDLGVESLTLYAFSSENWSRPLAEVTTLFKLLKKFILLKGKEIVEENLRFSVVGNRHSIPADAKQLVLDLEALTQNNTGMQLNFAFAYGGRQEILHSINQFIQESPGKLMDECDVEAHLQMPISNVDLLIRTGGDCRISNFLLWQCAYAELYFTKTYWPEFSAQEFQKIVEHVGGRHRRFGSVELASFEESQLVAKRNQQKILQNEGSLCL